MCFFWGVVSNAGTSLLEYAHTLFTGNCLYSAYK